jgi:hypothetical protein
MKQLVWALCAETLVLGALLLLALDVVAHNRVQELGGVNVWGYRGPVAHHKEPNETRIAIVGGTRAFGWGEPATALASQLRRIVMLTTDQPGRALRPIVVVNLGRLAALADSYPATIAHYSDLRPDYICLYDDLGVRGAEVAGRASGLFERTGYAPILPLVLREKGMVLEFGDVNRGYAPADARKIRARSPVRRAAADGMTAIAATLEAVDGFIAPGAGRSRRQASAVAPPATYADDVIASIDVAHQHASGVVLMLSPAETPEQRANLAALDGRLAEQTRPWLRVVDLGAHPELLDPSMRVDAWNYSSAGLTRVAELLAPAVLAFIASR